MSIVEVPRYILEQPLYADDVLWEIGTEIEFSGIPNEWMTPLNDSAKIKIADYLESIGNTMGMDEFIDRAYAEAKDPLVRLVHAPEKGPNVMGAPKQPETVKAGPGRPKRVAKIMGTVSETAVPN
jgi:hypothetical protein